MNKVFYSINSVITFAFTVLLFLFVFASLDVQRAHAQVDVSCWDGDCLKNGWTWFDFRSGSKTDIACYRDGCELSGWIGQNEYQRYYTQCKERGCFLDGWYKIDQNSQTLIHNVVCRSSENQSTEPDCFKYGWVIYSAQGQEAVISCFYNDCKQEGWLVQTSYQLIRANCKAGGCWQKGWIEN